MFFLKLTVFLSLFLFFLGCKKSTEPIGEIYPLDIENVADGFGDRNGVASESELEFIRKYFSVNKQAWGIGSIVGTYAYVDVSTIPADTVIKTFSRSNLVGPFPSEENLRKLFTWGVRTPYVGIYVLTQGHQCCIIRFFKSGGGFVNKNNWVELQIM